MPPVNANPMPPQNAGLEESSLLNDSRTPHAIIGDAFHNQNEVIPPCETAIYITNRNTIIQRILLFIKVVLRRNSGHSDFSLRISSI